MRTPHCTCGFLNGCWITKDMMHGWTSGVQNEIELPQEFCLSRDDFSCTGCYEVNGWAAFCVTLGAFTMCCLCAGWWSYGKSHGDNTDVEKVPLSPLDWKGKEYGEIRDGQEIPLSPADCHTPNTSASRVMQKVPSLELESGGGLGSKEFTTFSPHTSVDD